MGFEREQIGNCTLYRGDCREVLPTLAPVDCVMTSPPYLAQRHYNGLLDDWSALVPVALERIPRHPLTQLFINLGLVYCEGVCVEYWNEMLTTLRACGLRLYGWYVWDKGYGRPGDWHGRLAPAHEWVFHLNSQAGIAHKWVPTQQRQRPTRSGLRNPDGSISKMNSPHACGQAYKVPDSVLRLWPNNRRGGIEQAHPAVFPVSLPEQLLRTFTQPGQVVCDPFMGSGTTGVACLALDRMFIGIEIDRQYFDLACRRLEEASRQLTLVGVP